MCNALTRVYGFKLRSSKRYLLFLTDPQISNDLLIYFIYSFTVSPFHHVYYIILLYSDMHSYFIQLYAYILTPKLQQLTELDRLQVFTQIHIRHTIQIINLKLNFRIFSCLKGN